MKRAMTVIGLLTILALVSGTTLATPFTGGLCLDNMNNTSTNPSATTGGLVWIDTGSGPAKLNEDINMQFLCGGAQNTLAGLLNLNYTPNLANGPQYSTFLLSDGTATGIGTFFGSGIFLDPNGIEWVTYQTSTLTPQTKFYFQIKAWTGSYNTYDDAYAASAAGTPGVYVGKTPVFINLTATGIGFPPEFDSMPALVLAKAVPEPSTLLLLAAGLMGLLAYAWRKRR
jgi:hypothetical protein